MKKLIMFAILLLSACYSYAVDSYSYRIVDAVVIDGDTIKATVIMGLNVALINQEIRVAGIDTPEIHTKNLHEKKAGIIAKKYLWYAYNKSSNNWIKNAVKDKYGRILANVVFDGVDIAREMVDKKMGREYYGDKREPWTTAELSVIVDEAADVTDFNDNSIEEKKIYRKVNPESAVESMTESD